MPLELADFLEWLNEQEYTYASDSKSKNKLKVDLKGIITIYAKGEIVWCGNEPAKAIEVYNNL